MREREVMGRMQAGQVDEGSPNSGWDVGDGAVDDWVG
jgi:hypothetical protein